MASPVYILGGYQTDFKRNWAREGKEIFDLFKDTLDGGLAETKLDASEIETAHVGNFASEMFCNQGHLGGFFAAADPKLTGIPAGPHRRGSAARPPRRPRRRRWPPEEPTQRYWPRQL